MRTFLTFAFLCCLGAGASCAGGEFGESNPTENAATVEERSEAEEIARLRTRRVELARRAVDDATSAAEDYARENALDADETTVLVATLVNAATEPALLAARLNKTPAAAAVYDTQKDRPEFSSSESASTLLTNYARRKGFLTSWDAGRQRMFIVQSSSFNTVDPSSDPLFAEQREVAMRQAMLLAKSDILKYIATTMSAREQFDIPGTDIHAQLHGEHEKAKTRLAEQRQALAKLLVAVDKARADELADVGFGDRAMELFDAAIRRIDSQYSREKVAQDKMERVRAIERRYNEALAALRQIESQAEVLRHKPLESTLSEVEIMAAMPLLGAVIAQTAESWDPKDKKYEVAVLTCWSPDFEKAARAALTGEVPSSDRVGTQSLNEWLKTQDIGGLIGARQFLDPQGNRHFLGITARPVVANSARDRTNRMVADTFAMQQAAFCLFADVSTYTAARQQADAVNDDSGLSALIIASSLEAKTTQSIKKMQLHGIAPVFRGTAKHPLTGQELYVSIYGISPASAAQAMEAQQKAMLSSIRLYDIQSYLRGRQAALTERVTRAKEDDSKYREGKRAGMALPGMPAKNTGKGQTAPTGESPDKSEAPEKAGGALPVKGTGVAREGAIIPGGIDVH